MTEAADDEYRGQQSDPSACTPTIWSSLDEWGRGLPPWKRLALATLVRSGKLSDKEVEVCWGLFLSAHGLGQAKDEVTVPDMVSGRPAIDTSPITLKRLHGLRNVNALADNAELTFGDQLTVVYGSNGAGKTGFARVLAGACFSRSRVEVLTDIRGSSGLTPSALFDLVGLDGSELPQSAFGEGVEDDRMLRFTVFDSGAAQVHLTDQGPLGFEPVGFDVFTALAELVTAFGQRIQSGMSERQKPNPFTALFDGPSPVCAAIDALSADTDMAFLAEQAQFGEAEARQMEEVEQRCQDLQSKSPADLLIKIAQDRQDIQAIVAGAAALTQGLLGEKSSMIFETWQKRENLRNQVASLGSITFGGASAPEASAAWLSFVEAARALASHEREGYPHEDDNCLLCKQVLSVDAQDRLQGLWKFLSDATYSDLQEAEGAARSLASELELIDTRLISSDSRAATVLKVLDSDAHDHLELFVEEIEKRRMRMVALLRADGSPLDLPTPRYQNARFTALDVSLASRERELIEDDGLDRTIAAALEELRWFRHRKLLAGLIDQVQRFANDLRWMEAARPAMRHLTTRPITDKETELFDLLIGGAYRAAFAAECALLRCDLPVEVKTAGQKGKTVKKLAVSGGFRPDRVLSEGEQKAIALADFLTEVNLNPTSAGIILDDPVTSL